MALSTQQAKGRGKAKRVALRAISAPEARVSLDDVLKFAPMKRAAAAKRGATFRLRDADGT